MAASKFAENLFQYSGGMEKHDLNSVLQNFMDYPEEIDMLSHSPYFDISDLVSQLKKSCHNFSVLTLNVQSICSKFDKLYPIFDHLSEHNIHFSAICLQETWLKGPNPDTSLYNIPNYTAISLGATCSSHGGLTIYLHNSFQYRILDLYTPSNIWEGQFIEIYGPNIPKKIVLCNIYRPPRDNNSNRIIDAFIKEFFPILNKLSKNSTETIVLGDFNINLLEVEEREKYHDFYSHMVSHGFIPNITLPTRFATKKRSLIDQIYSKFTRQVAGNTNSGILFGDTSDHLACFTVFNHIRVTQNKHKFVTTRKMDTVALENFSNDIKNINLIEHIQHDPESDPNINYNIISESITQSMDTHMPIKTEKFNKYRHKGTPWITNEIIHSIKYRDKLYKSFKSTKPSSACYTERKINLTTYNKIPSKTIRNAKQQYYHDQLLKCSGDIKKVWKTIR